MASCVRSLQLLIKLVKFPNSKLELRTCFDLVEYHFLDVGFVSAVHMIAAYGGLMLACLVEFLIRNQR